MLEYQYLFDLGIMFLIPIAPAYILYKSLPSKALVSGPFKGVKIDLSGGFAGYFLLVLIALGYLESAAPSQTKIDKFEKWTVSGKLKLSDTRGYDNPLAKELVKVFYFPSRSELGVLTDRQFIPFSVEVPAWRDKDNQLHSLVTMLIFDAENHDPTYFPFEAALQGGEVTNNEGSVYRYDKKDDDHRIEIIDSIAPRAK